MPNGEFVPVMIATLSLTRLGACQLIANNVIMKWKKGTHGPAESGATWRILGMFSKVPGSAGLTTSCSLRASSRRLGADVMMAVWVNKGS